MQWLMKSFESEIKAAPDVQKPMTGAARRNMVRRNAVGSPITLNTAPWSQEAPFNSQIPRQPLTGCVGTAMSIIMKYHEFPERGTGSYNGVNFDVAYDWANMRDDNYRHGYRRQRRRPSERWYTTPLQVSARSSDIPVRAPTK